MVKRYMVGLSPQPDRVFYSKQYDSVIEMSQANYDKCNNSDWFIMDGGVPRLKNKAELKVDADVEAKESGRKEAKQSRNEALDACTVEVNGNVYQAREKDAIRIQTVLAALEAGQMYDWHMADDEPVSVPKEDLQEALGKGIAAVMKIRAEFTAAWKAL